MTQYVIRKNAKLQNENAPLCEKGYYGRIATQSIFFDETGRRVRTKKKIMGEDGKIQEGRTVRYDLELPSGISFGTEPTNIRQRLPVQ